MKTIIKNITSYYEIKNSKFITLLYQIDDSFNLNNILNIVKKDYPKATHYCYCYRTLNLQKVSDDGEPTGTAGTPMLNVLIKEDIINVLVITVRYFGGIKLGAGGLVRAYTKSLTNALSTATFKNLEEGYIIKLTTDYNNQKKLDYLLKEVNIIKKDFNEKITYTFQLPKDKLNIIYNYDYIIIKEELI